jgi:ribosomal protein L11 methyltransferase
MTPSERAAALAVLDHSDTCLTARAFAQQIAATLNVPVPRARTVLKHLVTAGDLTYQEIYGTTCIIRNFHKPVRVTRHFFLIPPDIKSIAGPDELDIRLLPGISFGSGHHPTTRLCLDAIDHLMFTLRPSPSILNAPGADIGTGSGVLAIALCRAGLPRCLACDIDPNAVSEAKKNIALNALETRIPVSDLPIPATGPKLGIICANLRTPTLETLAPLFQSRITPGGYLVFSGIREWEAPGLKAHFAKSRFSPAWEKTDKHWTGIILTDTPGPCPS